MAMKTDKNSQVSKITKEYLRNRYSKSTEEKLQRWFIEEDDSEEKEKASLEYWNELDIAPNSDTHRALERANKRIGQDTKTSIVPFRRRLLRIAAIFIPAMILVGGFYFYTQKEQIVQETTAYGETKQIILSDGSKIWINAGSTLKYPKEFKKSIRSVSLEGEAYFTVMKDASKPFVVQTNNLSVKVLGTEFNVKAYRNDSRTIATLNTGKIEVKTNTNQTQLLKPNEQLMYDNQSAKIDVETVAANDISSWKAGQLIFTDASFEEILQTLERRFNVSFEVTGNMNSSAHGYSVKFLKNDSLEQILNVLEDVTGVKLRVKN